MSEDSFWKIPEVFNFQSDVVECLAREADKLALVHKALDGTITPYTFSDVARKSAALSAALQALGVRKGHRIIVMFPRRPEWQIAMLAVLRLGAVPIPCIEMLTAKDVAYRVRHAGATAAITSAKNVAKFAEVTNELRVKVAIGPAYGWDEYEQLIDDYSNSSVEPAVVRAEDPAILYYTSGSTGLPKGVLHASRALYAWRSSAKHWLDLSRDDLIWCTADTGWSKAGTSILFGPWSMGSAVFMYEGAFDPVERLTLLREQKITVYCAAATELLQVADAGLAESSLPDLRRVVSAGEALNPAVVARWQDGACIDPAEAYGQTETLMTILTPAKTKPRSGFMGSSAPGCELSVLREDGSFCDTDEIGQIALLSPNPQLMIEYLDDPVRTEKSFVENEKGRWFLSGDLASQNVDGYFEYCGRNDDIINTSGYRVGPFEVESILLEHPAIAECAVVAEPDLNRGEIIKAVVVLRHDFDASESLVNDIQHFVKKATAPYKYPRKVVFLEALPKTLTGKIQRNVLRQI